MQSRYLYRTLILTFEDNCIGFNISIALKLPENLGFQHNERLDLEVMLKLSIAKVTALILEVVTTKSAALLNGMIV